MIHLIVYILSLPFIFMVSILPFKLLYLFSDFLYFIIYYIVGYRKKVVLDNLKIAFPEKTNAELQKIRKKFYHHFIDVFMEMLKTFTISNQDIMKRFELVNKEELEPFMAKHDNILLMSSHHGNYEWMFSLNLLVDHKGFAAYKKVKNKYFNNLIVKSRSRFNTTLVATKDFLAQVEVNDQSGEKNVYGLLSDQSPKLNKAHHWCQFFGKTVPVHTGTEMLAKKYNYPVVYIEKIKVKRGFYKAKFEILTENPRDWSDYAITDLFMQKLENHIKQEPENYFWTHKRFKHMK